MISSGSSDDLIPFRHGKEHFTQSSESGTRLTGTHRVNGESILIPSRDALDYRIDIHTESAEFLPATGLIRPFKSMA